MARVLMWEGINASGRKVRGVVALQEGQEEITARRELVCTKGNAATPVRVRRIILKKLPDLPAGPGGGSEGNQK